MLSGLVSYILFIRLVKVVDDVRVVVYDEDKSNE